MIHLIRRIGPLSYHRKWFARSCAPADRFRLISLRQFLGTAPFGFVRRTFQTIHIDLSLSSEELFAGQKKNTAYEVRRAEKDGVVVGNLAEGTFYREGSLDVFGTFRSFFNRFAENKGLPTLSEQQVASFGAALSVTTATLEDCILVMHAWLFDPTEGRARLLYSATTVDPLIDRAIVGRANRLLHFQDLVTQKAAGFQLCDLGGVAFDSEKPGTAGIDQFKLGFGGTVVHEDHFDSIPLAAAGGLKHIVHKLRELFASKNARTQEKV